MHKQGMPPNETERICERVIIRLHQRTGVLLGIYKNQTAIPQYIVCFHPQPTAADIKQAITYSEEKDGWKLVYFFQNASDKTFTATIAERQG